MMMIGVADLVAMSGNFVAAVWTQRPPAPAPRPAPTGPPTTAPAPAPIAPRSTGPAIATELPRRAAPPIAMAAIFIEFSSRLVAADWQRARGEKAQLQRWPMPPARGPQ